MKKQESVTTEETNCNKCQCNYQKKRQQKNVFLYLQQQHTIHKKGDINCTCEAYKTGLDKDVVKWTKQGDLIILTIDGNKATRRVMLHNMF